MSGESPMPPRSLRMSLPRSAVLGMLLLGITPGPSVFATGHGPVYGLATPTLGKGGFSLDVSIMNRVIGDKSSAMFPRW